MDLSLPQKEKAKQFQDGNLSIRNKKRYFQIKDVVEKPSIKKGHQILQL